MDDCEGIQPAGAYEDVRSVQNKTKVPRVIKYLQPEEVNGLLDYVGSRACLRDQAMVHVLLDAGVRISELVELDVGDVDFQTGELRVRRGRERGVPIPTRTARKLAWSLGERGLLELPDDGEIVLPATGGWPPTSLVEPPDMRRVPGFLGSPQSPMPFGVSGDPSSWAALCWREGAVKRKWCAKGCQKTCSLCADRSYTADFA